MLKVGQVLYHAPPALGHLFWLSSSLPPQHAASWHGSGA